MGFKKHTTLKCHTCKRKQAKGGTKKAGSWEGDGWKLVKMPKMKNYVMLCPACVRRQETV